MKRILILLFFAAFASTEIVAQDKEPVTDPEVVLKIDDDSNEGAQPLYILLADNKKYEFAGEDNSDFLNEISPDWIESLTVLKDEAAVEKYGEKAGNGVVIIEFKDGALASMSKDVRKRFKKIK